MSSVWKLQDAKAQFSRVVQEAMNHGPQFVTRHGREAVVILSTAEYHQLTVDTPSFVDFLLKAPRVAELDIERSSELPREIEL